MRAAKNQQKSRAATERKLTEELDQTFPASDPPAMTEPGGGITGAEVKAVDPAPEKRRPSGERRPAK